MKINVIQNLFEQDKVIIHSEHGTEIYLTIGERIHTKHFGTCFFQQLTSINGIIYMDLMQIGKSRFIDQTSNHLRIMLTDEFIEENFDASYENDNSLIVDLDIDELL